MHTSKKVVRHTALALVAATGLAAVVLIPSWRGNAEADGEDRKPSTRLVVKCAPEKVQPLVAFVTKQGGTIYDLETMMPLRPERSKAEARLPALESAVPVWLAVRDALTTVHKRVGKRDAGMHPVSLQRVYIQEHELGLTFQTRDVKRIEELTRAILAHPAIVKRIGGANRPVERGAVAKMKSGAWRADLKIHFGPGGDGIRPTEEASSTITIDDLHAASVKAEVEQVYASNERLDIHRGTGVASISRAVTYGRAGFDAVETLLRHLEEIAGVKVAVLRLTLDQDGTAEFEKLNVRVARRVLWRRD